MANKSQRSLQQRPSRSRLETALANHGIVVPHPAAVRDYLASHRDLAKLVPLVCEQARREFGQEAELILQVYRDPEIDDCHLTLYVRMQAYDDAMAARMDRVTLPFEEQLCSASGYLLVTTDFRPPGAKHAL
jgi:hypothetical protein